VDCKELEFVLTLASNKYWCLCRHRGLYGIGICVDTVGSKNIGVYVDTMACK
jgi:hypothetical protein